MKFFNIDCHVSVIADMKNIFERLGHSVTHWSLSGHKWVFGLSGCPSNIITEFNWKSINEEMVNAFYKEHKNELDQYDVFLCCYPPIFLKLFEKFNKPIIVVAATRYDFPVASDPKRLAWLEDSLVNNKNLVLVANNAFDKAYCEKFMPTTNWEHIPSLCDYTKEKYNPTKKEKVLFSKFNINTDNSLIHQSILGRYTWKDLYSYSGIVHFPYNVSTMSMFEQYQAGVPLFLPNLTTALTMINNHNIPLFSEIVFPNRNPERQANQFLNKKWLKLSDFYNNTLNVNYFDNNFDFSINPKKTNSNKDSIFERWSKILERIKQ